MKREISTVATKFFAGLTRVMLIATMALTVPMLNACSDDDTSTTPNDKPNNGGGQTNTGNANGVVYNGGNKNCGAAKSSISFSFTADAGFTLDTDKSDMVEFLTPEQSSIGGNYNSTIQVKANSSSEERKANIYITVSGYDRTLLFTVTQAGATIDDIDDELLAYVDKRLAEEYYWLDEYNEKRLTFDFKLEAEEYLEEALLSMTTNIADGGYDDGDRYLYSYIYQMSSSSASSGTRAASTVTGYGIDLSNRVLAMNSAGTELCLVVDHVYPESPAAKAGIERGDNITHYNGKVITSSNLNDAWYDIYYSLSNSVKISVYGKGDNISLSVGSYYESVIAHYDVYELTTEDENVIKIGYLSYLGFEADYDSELIAAMKEISAAGVDEMILDLRNNGGGSVNSSIILSSMILNKNHVGDLYQTLERHEDNPKGTTECHIINAYNGQGLPNLDISRIFVIVTGNTASASEMVITGLEGLGMEVITIGTQTEGKNCGMDVTQIKTPEGTYEYAPITFLNFNAQGFNDYPDGLPADSDMEYIAKNAQNETIALLADYYPIPMEPWGGYSLDVAMLEALMQIQGKSILDIPADEESAIKKAPKLQIVKHNRNAATRSSSFELKEKRKVKGATLTEEERIMFDSQKYK